MEKHDGPLAGVRELRGPPGSRRTWPTTWPGSRNPIEDLGPGRDPRRIHDLRPADLRRRPASRSTAGSRTTSRRATANHVNPEDRQAGQVPVETSPGASWARCTRSARPASSRRARSLWQLQGKYDKFHGDPKLWERFGKKKPADWSSLQVKECAPRPRDLARGRGKPRGLQRPGTGRGRRKTMSGRNREAGPAEHRAPAKITDEKEPGSFTFRASARRAHATSTPTGC